MGLPDPLTKVPPTPGRIVLYRSKRNPYDIPAVITTTTANLWPEGVERGDVPGLDSDTHVHLHVFTPGQLGAYGEHNIPQVPPRPLQDPDVQPGSWRWPILAGPPNPPMAAGDRPVG